MRIESNTELSFEREVFEWLAGALRLRGELPAVRRDGLFLFDEPELVVRVVDAENQDLAGDYSCGTMRVFNCPRCTSARRIWAFSHEIVHAWYESYSWARYFYPEVEQVADRFADEVIVFLGGTIVEHGDCATYGLPSQSIGRLQSDGSSAAIEEIFAKVRAIAWVDSDSEMGQ